MLERLVESIGTHRPSPLRKRLVAVCTVSVLALTGTALLGSMFNEALAMSSEGWETERLFYPVMNAPSELTPKPVNKSAPAVPTKTSVAVRRGHIARLDETINEVPDGISTVPNALKERPLGPYIQGDTDSDPPNTGFTRGTGDETVGFGGGSGQWVESKARTNEPVSVAPPPNLTAPDEKPGYIGIVNGKALDLVIPAYPQSARQLGIKGHVKVQVVIDEDGNVKSASLVEGHGMLRSAAIAAARASRFTPTTLNGRNVPVRGLIIYNFR